MSKSMQFFLIFLVTLVGTRIFIFFHQQPSPTILGIRLHHYMYGIIIMIAAYFLRNFTHYALALYSFGLALFVDQIPYILIEQELFGEEKYNGDIYWDKTHLVLLVVIVVLIFFFRDHLIPFEE